jgi:hypothetical protein
MNCGIKDPSNYTALLFCGHIIEVLRRCICTFKSGEGSGAVTTKTLVIDTASTVIDGKICLPLPCCYNISAVFTSNNVRRCCNGSQVLIFAS